MSPETYHYDLLKFIKILKRRQWVIYNSIIILVSLTVIYILVAPKYYEASSKILITSRKYTLGPEIMYRDEEKEIENELEILNSANFILKVFENLKMKKKLPMFSSNNPYYEFSRNLSILPIGRSNTIRLSYVSKNPEEAMIVANTLAETAVEFSLDFEKAEIIQVMKFLETQIPVAQERLKDIEKKLEEYKSSTGILSVPEYVNVLSNEISSFDHIYNETILEFASKETALKFYKERLNDIKKNLSDDLSGIVNASIKNIRTELFNLENELLTFELKGVSEDNPRKMLLKKNIEDLKKKLREEVLKVAGDSLFVNDPLSLTFELSLKIIETEIDFEILKSKKQVLENLKENYDKKWRSFPYQETKLVSLIREYKIAEDVVKLLTEKYEEFRIEEAKKIGNVRIIEFATMPLFPVRPQKKLSLLLGFFGGVFIGIVGIIVLEIFANKIVDEDDLKEFTHIPVIGIIPEVKLKDTSGGFTRYLITNFDNNNIVESYRILKTNLGFMNVDRKLKTFLITSSLPEEGKTTVCANLALTTALAGYKTLIIDFDLRKPALHKVFGIENSKGLTEAVLDVKRTDGIMNKIQDNLYLITSGKIPPDASELINSDSMKELMEKVSKGFDYVFLDSTPFVVPETRLIGMLSDSVILVLRSNFESPDVLNRTINVINSINKKIIGIVITRLLRKHHHYYYSSYYYYKEEK